MSPAIEDARNYITIKPVPAWKEAEDSRLQARSFDHYTLQEPNREKVFKTNYKRRQEQMTVQGYKSLLWKPYQEIGQPLYLDPKQLVQASLGQQTTHAGHQLSFKNGKSEEEVVDETKVTSPRPKQYKRKMSTASFVMKYQQEKDFQDLFKDLSSVRETMASVKMGHALFPILEKAQNMRDNAFLIKKQNDMRNIKEELHMRLSNATFDDDVEPEEHVWPLSVQASRRASIRSAGSRVSIASSGKIAHPPSNPGMTAVKADVHASAADHIRPYSPMFTNICQTTDEVNRNSVWKQLCCLHWILESCLLEANFDNQYQNKVMVPLSECWDTSNPGGRTRDSRIVSQDRKNNHKWTKFARTQSYKAILRSRSRRKVSAMPFQSPLRKNWSLASDLASYQGDAPSRRPPSAKNRPPSTLGQYHSSQGSVDGEAAGYDAYEHIRGMARPMSAGQSSITTTIAGGTVADSEYGDDDTATDGGHSIDIDKMAEKEDSLPEKDYHEHLVKLLSTVKESVGREMDRREKTALVVAEANQKLPMSVYEWSKNSYFKIGKKEVNISKIVVPPATPTVEYTPPLARQKHMSGTRIRPHTAAVSRTRQEVNTNAPSSRPGTAGGARPKPTRPMSSPAKLVSAFNFKFSSGDKSRKLDRIKEKFDDVNDAKALELHNQLTELDKCRKQRMEVKFDTLRGTCSMHRDFKGMREAAQNKFLRQKMNKTKRSSIVICEWYNNLVHNLPDNIHEDPPCSYILQKLSVFGMKMLQNMHSITPDVFLSSLKTLRPWELCSPDVSAAIDYVREHIVNMPASEFDEWRASKLTRKEAPVGVDQKQVSKKQCSPLSAKTV